MIASHIQINNFMGNRRRTIRRNQIIDINQIISDMNGTSTIKRRSPVANDEVYYNLIYDEGEKENSYEEKKYELSSYLNNDERTCRICFEGETIDNELIHPCLCKGTQKYIHLKCLQEWRKINKDNPEKRDYCEICKYHYAVKEYDNYLNYKISHDIITNSLIFILLILLSGLLWSIDYFSDFIFIKFFTFYNHEKNIIYIKFSKIKKNEIYFTYGISVEIYTFAFYIINIGLFILLRGYLYSNRKYIKNASKNNYYKKNIKYYRIFYKIISYSLLYSIYLTTIVNEFYILSNILPMCLIANIFFFNLYISKHNKFLKNIDNFNIQNQLIYSFEENPLILHLGEL